METNEFLKTIYEYAETGYTQIFALPSCSAQSVLVDDINNIDAVINLYTGQDIYFTPGITTNPINAKPNDNDIIGIPALWVDIDIYNPNAHKAGNLPSNVAEAMSILPDELPPSIIVHSGYGLHAWWILKECWYFDSQDEKEQAYNLLQRLQANIRTRAATFNWKIDATFDLSRVMRLPGTLNYKNKAMPVKSVVIESDSSMRYNPSDFDDIIPELEIINSSNKDRTLAFERRITDGSAVNMLQNCAFIQHIQINAKSINYGEWLAALSNIVRASDGIEAAHEISKIDIDRYNQVDTDKKIDECLTQMNPQSCEYIRSNLGFKGCPESGCNIKAPCGWSLGKVPQAIAKIKSITIPNAENVFNNDTLGALALLEKNDVMEFNKFKEKCRGQVNLNDVNKAIKEYKKQNFTVIEGGQTTALQVGQKVGDVTTKQLVPDTPLDLALPVNFTYDINGIEEVKLVGEIVKRNRAAGSPVIISERIFNIDNKTEKVQLTFKYFNQWCNTIQKKSDVFSAKNIINLVNYGLSTSSESAKFLVRYLEGLESANQNTIPLKYAVSKIGWRDNSNEFIIPNVSNYRIDMEDEGEVTEAFSVKGDFEKWKETSREIRKEPFARFVLATAFATPLIKIFRNRNFMLYFWGTSGGGKTASMVWALSIWGSPARLMKSFYGTQNGIEKALAFSNDFPMVINEKQVMNGKDKQDLFEQIVYMLEGGRGKLRASKTGLQKTALWRSIGMASGEEPLSKESSIQGVKTRLLELNVYPVIKNDSFAKSLYSLAEDNHGFAGPYFVERLLKEYENNYEEINRARNILADILRKNFPEHFSVHIDNVALVAMADYLSSMWIFDIDKKQAEIEAYQLACSMLQELPTERQISDVERGWDFVQSWLASNDGRFEKEHQDIKITPSFGFKKGGYTCIYPEYLTKALQDAGFSPDKLLKEFANKGRIATESDGAKRRFKVQVKHNTRKIRVIKIYDSNQENLI